MERGRRDRDPVPGSLGERLRQLRIGARQSQAALADALNTTTATISRYETAGVTPPDHVIARLAEHFRVTKAFIRDGDTSTRRAPIVGRVGAGGLVFPVEEALDLGGIEVPGSWTDATAYLIEGDSMLPEFEEGGRLVVRGPMRFDETEVMRRLCEVMTEDGQALFKKVRRSADHPGKYDLLSTNAAPIEGVGIRSARPLKAYFPPE